MSANEELTRMGEVFDHIITTDVSGRGSISKLYAAARKKVGGPLALTAAEALSAKVDRGDFVFFLTGFMLRPQFSAEIAESDGPAGTALLARAIYKARGGIPVVFVEETIASSMAAVLRAAGFVLVPPEKAKESAVPSRRPTQAAVLEIFPVDHPDPQAVASQYLQQYAPAAVISCERAGPNARGVIHNAQGKDVSVNHARTDLLMKLSYEQEKGALTIGIGDGGNEIGMGSIAKELASFLPYGSKCDCPCQGGIIPESEVDVLVAASVSNWGASAIAAVLGLLNNVPDAAPSSEMETRLIRSSLQAGFIDGPTGTVEERVDGMDLPVHASIATLLDQAMRFAMKKSLWK